MALKSRLEVLTKADFDRVHQASLKILRETGIVFHTEEALEYFRKRGAKIENRTVFITEEMVKEALATCPKQFKWRGGNAEKEVTVGEGFLVQPNVGPVYVQDIENGRRKALLEDYANIQKLCQSSDAVDIVGSIPLDASDISAENKYLYMMYEILKNTDKPMIGMCAERHHVQQQFDMVEIALGKEYMEKHATIGVLVNSLSPLAYAPETLDTMIEYAKRKQPILLAPCIMAGVSGPVHLLGTAVLQNTELLAGIVLTQLVNPGAPVVYAVASTSAYMKAASFSAGTPEAMLLNTANLQMGLEYYQLPTRTMCGITHSKVVDCQAGYESMQSIMMGMMSGAHMAVQAMGVLDAIMATSYEMFIIDEELVRRVRRIKQGIDTSDEALSVDIIQEVAHSGNYLMHTSTFTRFKDFWLPTVSDWESFNDWEAAGAVDVATVANRKYKERLASAPETLLTPEVDQDLKAYIAKESK